MAVLITGTSTGIGKATAEKFISMGYKVIGIDRNGSAIPENDLYRHIVWDITDTYDIPKIEEPIEYLINNAGTQCENDIETNLKGAMLVTSEFGFQPSIKAIVNVASTSAHNGAEFPEYAASKGGLLSYTKYAAQRVAEFGATCNSISPGGVITDMNKHILEDENLYNQVLNETLLNKWADSEEIADWIFFIAVINKSMTAQDIIIDNGELSKFNFIW